MTPAAANPTRLPRGMAKGRVPREIREKQLIAVAEEVFAKDGYQATSLEEIARHAGVTRQFLYKVFGGKEALYVACHSLARRHLQQMVLEAAAPLAAARTTDELRAVVRDCTAAYFQFVEDHGRAWDVLFGSGSAVAGPAVVEVRKLRLQTVALIAGLIKQGAPAADPQLIDGFAHSMSGATEQLAYWWREHPDVPLARVVEISTDFSWRGIEQLL